MNLKKLENKTILITGASSGLGKEFVKILSSLNNTTLIIVARRKDKLDEIKQELANNTSLIYVINQDLSVSNGPEIIFQKTKELNLSVDILINNAGFALSDEFTDLDLQEYMKMVDLNIKAVIKLIY